jgi:hypothetical protein
LGDGVEDHADAGVRPAIVALLAAVTLVACASTPQEPAALLHCDNGDTVEVGYSGNFALVTYKNKLHRMHLEMSRISARYVGDGLEWQTEGLGKGVMTPLQQEGAPAPLPTTCKSGQPSK